jgi:hypothetical protein
MIGVGAKLLPSTASRGTLLKAGVDSTLRSVALERGIPTV